MSSTATSHSLIRESLDRNQKSLTDEPTLISKPSDSEAAELSVQESIRQMAYALWERRGRPEGSPEKDWREAEEQVRLLQERKTLVRG
jgi:Protein of unknown function (DUF2934)